MDHITPSLKVKFAQSCPTLCDPMNYTVHGILHSRILKWIAFPSPVDLPDPGIKLGSPVLQADSLLTELSEKPTPSSPSKSSNSRDH